MPVAIQYKLPDAWIAYDQQAIQRSLVNAKASIKALTMIPFQRRWVEELQRIQLKMEISGTSQIEGAQFVGDELDAALEAESPTDLMTRSQRQANSALRAYEWVSKVPEDEPISVNLIKHLHRLVVTGCDDDHCEPGGLRRVDQNVTVGSPRHRGVPGGRPCAEALERLANEVRTTFRGHDPLIQAIATHYHFAAMHPFLDGNGRTARALEALMLQRAGLKDVLFVPMSNFYHDAKDDYLSKLAETRSRNHDLTPFLIFALDGVEAEVSRLTKMLQHEVSKGLFRNFVNELAVRLASTRMRVIVKRQLTLLGHLLDSDQDMDVPTLAEELSDDYRTRKDPAAALVRDLARLDALGAVKVRLVPNGEKRSILVSVNLDWPRTMTETEFFRQVSELPKSKKYSLLTN